jgi:dihydropteroate synthase
VAHPTRPLIMGILNITPDSFSDGGLYFRNTASVLEYATRMVADGADIIDVGGEAAGPTAAPVSPQEEIDRTVPVVQLLRAELPPGVSIAVNTRHPDVAEAALRHGADMINCTGACAFDPRMMAIAATAGCTLILWDLPTRMGSGTAGRELTGDPVGDVLRFLRTQVDACVAAGVDRDRIWVDPGFGSPHSTVHVVEMLRRLDEFLAIGCRVAVGVSRKRHLGDLTRQIMRTADTPDPLSRLDAALAETAWSIIKGATMIRTHDVRSTRIVADLVTLLGRP